MFNVSGASGVAPIQNPASRPTLFWAAAVVVLVLPLWPARADAAPIVCVSQTATPCVGTYFGGAGFQSNLWKFYSDPTLTDLLYNLEIGGIPTRSFFLDVHDLVTTQAALAGGGTLVNFPGAVCIPTYDETRCGLFQVFETNGSFAAWVDGYRLTITWFANENPLSQPPDDGLNTILQAKNASLPVFSNQLADIDYDPAPTPIDPAIGGKGDSFSTFGAFRGVTAPPSSIPEPASVLLLGTAFGAALARARTRRR